MTYTDRIHGTVEITDPVIIDLIESPALQRLKKIDQYGYRPLWVNPDVKIGPYDSTRFVHSMGVYLLLKRFGASLEEQIAGLIHDVSHAAFSHCADYIFGEDNEKRQHFQDSIFETFVRKSTIPAILEAHGFSLERILDDTNFPLKEQKLPDLCADRIAYSLQDALNFEFITQEEAKYFVDSLSVKDSRWVFRSYDDARRYAEFFRRMNAEYWVCPSATVMHKGVGDVLRYALDKGYIAIADLFTDDARVLEMITSQREDDEALAHLLDIMNNRYAFRTNRDTFDLHAFCKSRAIDPLCVHNGAVVRVSDVDSAWKDVVNEAMQPVENFIQFYERV